MTAHIFAPLINTPRNAHQDTHWSRRTDAFVEARLFRPHVVDATGRDVALLIKGHTGKEVALTLDISPRTWPRKMRRHERGGFDPTPSR
ncbi:hypothetical protein [Mesorhizobium sp. ORS 3428]|uniref:hypothetical protein n=1 Tax=Mesorhizobium sp. ORS 3428 TaxID=540997 RepID=UPI00104277FA|nr:hypothetical protein [Mesorhizobium sp. ORS 3428]